MKRNLLECRQSQTNKDRVLQSPVAETIQMKTVKLKDLMPKKTDADPLADCESSHCP